MRAGREFFEERRLGKLWRRLKEEPLIPLGCLATCYALYQATKSMRRGDHRQTNKMFRARVYAQGFTLVALVAGSIFYQDERLRRKRFDEAVEEKKAAEKRDRWLKELEARDIEDRAWRERFEGVAERARVAEEELHKGKGTLDGTFKNRSVLDQVASTRDVWRGR